MEKIQNKERKILILGSGPIKIGQAGEFDYSGSQALKALRDEKVKTVLVNPNIATVQTSEGMADTIYFLPVNNHFVEKVIEKERPDGILLSFGGQVALNCGISLYKKGVLEKYNVEILGTSIQAVMETEDRKLFINKLDTIGVGFARATTVKKGEDVLSAGRDIGYPLNIRSSYSLGGEGSGICKNGDELIELSSKVFAVGDSILIEESLKGWKEIEYEIIRDRYNNIVFVCDMENFDPMGIHTGDSIVVVPSQTLSNDEKKRLKQISRKVIENIEVIGECNIQLALNPETGDIKVVEVNARLSRSSALASKATGYPLAFIATKLALGYGLHELKNDATGGNLVNFEPSIDYVVCKIPRWDFDKFEKTSKTIGTGMKSVGEVMAISKSFEEAIQKGIRMVDDRNSGFGTNDDIEINLEEELVNPSDKRLLAIEMAFRNGYSVKEIHKKTKIDDFFLYKLEKIFKLTKKIRSLCPKGISRDLLLKAKKNGFSDFQLASIMKKESEDVEVKVEEIRALRKKMKVLPFIKRINIIIKNNQTESEYLYVTYHASESDIARYKGKESIAVLGSGVYKIGSSVEFDWCCVSAIETLKANDYCTIMINCNPETVSTDYDICDRLYFEELTLERVLDIMEFERPNGVIVSMGGQISNNLALPLYEKGINVLGTSPLSIDESENRQKFSKILDDLEIKQPRWIEAKNRNGMEDLIKETGFPLLVRPSYVLSGLGMRVVFNSTELDYFLNMALKVFPEYPVVLSEFINEAIELDVDAVSREGVLLDWAISEHLEMVGIHSGDATLIHPPQTIPLNIQEKLVGVVKLIAWKFKITGPFNVQFLAKGEDFWVIECNLRSSRSFPFISKVAKKNLIESAVLVIMGKHVENRSGSIINGVGVKVPQFSFSRLSGSECLTGVEMKSTGEAACLGRNKEEAFLKSMISVGYDILIDKIILVASVSEINDEFLFLCEKLIKRGCVFYLNKEMEGLFKKNNIEYEHFLIKNMNYSELFQKEKIGLSVITKNQKFDKDRYFLRRSSVDFNIPLITDMNVAKLFLQSILKFNINELKVESWNRYYR